MTEIGYYRCVPEWSLAGNDRFGDCVFCTAANFVDLMSALAGNPEVVPEAEAERFYAVETGWTADNPASDRGEVLKNMLEYWLANGNPSDPLDKITDWYQVASITANIQDYGAVFCWVTLPLDADGEPDFSDDATTGADGHALLLVGADNDGVTCVTWGALQRFSWHWWSRFGRDCFVVEHPRWRVPLDPARPAEHTGVTDAAVEQSGSSLGS